MVSQRQKLEWIKTSINDVNEALGTQYKIVGFAPSRFNIMSPSSWGVGEDMIQTGTLEKLDAFLEGILFHVALIKKGNKNNGN
jgi:hypothetical protein